MTKFQDLGLSDDVLKGIIDQGYEEAFPIQEAVIPVLLSGRDVVGQAHTGSGKTAAFALSMLQKIQPRTRNSRIDHGTNKRASYANTVMKSKNLENIPKLEQQQLRRARNGNPIRCTS